MIGGHPFERKAPFAKIKNFIQKGVSLFWRVGLLSREIMIIAYCVDFTKTVFQRRTRVH